MYLVCLDLEGVLVPEIWIAVAAHTQIPELTRTTRDEPDYDKLMHWRIALLNQRGLGLGDIQDAIAAMEPLPGAQAFLNDLRATYQVIILSDTFAEFAQPLLQRLSWPTIFCHSLDIDIRGRIVGYRLRMPNQKQEAVVRLKELNYKVVAAGDSYNDIAMLAAADRGILFRPPDNVAREFPQFPVTSDYQRLRATIDISFREVERS